MKTEKEENYWGTCDSCGCVAPKNVGWCPECLIERTTSADLPLEVLDPFDDDFLNEMIEEETSSLDLYCGSVTIDLKE